MITADVRQAKILTGLQNMGRIRSLFDWLLRLFIAPALVVLTEVGSCGRAAAGPWRCCVLLFLLAVMYPLGTWINTVHGSPGLLLPWACLLCLWRGLAHAIEIYGRDFRGDAVHRLCPGYVHGLLTAWAGAASEEDESAHRLLAPVVLAVTGALAWRFDRALGVYLFVAGGCWCCLFNLRYLAERERVIVDRSDVMGGERYGRRMLEGDAAAKGVAGIAAPPRKTIDPANKPKPARRPNEERGPRFHADLPLPLRALLDEQPIGRTAAPTEKPSPSKPRFQTPCPRCQAPLEIPRAAVGTKSSCSNCGHTFRIRWKKRRNVS